MYFASNEQFYSRQLGAIKTEKHQANKGNQANLVCKANQGQLGAIKAEGHQANKR